MGTKYHFLEIQDGHGYHLEFGFSVNEDNCMKFDTQRDSAT